MPTKKKVGRPIKHMAGKALWKGKRVYKVLETESDYSGVKLAGGPRGRYSKMDYNSLPKDGKPSKWYRHEGPVEMCHAGYHLTSNPRDWIRRNSDIIFEAEYQGEVIADKSLWTSEAKTCHRAIRLIRQVWLNDKGKLVRRKPKKA